MPPIRSYTCEETSAIVGKHGIEAFLIVAYVDSTEKDIRVPYETTTKVDSTGKRTTTSSGGYTKKQTTSFTTEANLVLASTGTTIWKAQVIVDKQKSTTSTSDEDVWSAIFDKVAETLIRDGIIKNPSIH